MSRLEIKLRDEKDEARLYRIYESIYRNMQRENDLISQRLGWAIFTSGGIFAATTILANITVNANWEPILIAPLYLAMAVLSYVAWRFSKLSLRGIKAAQRQHDMLRDHYDGYKAQFIAMGLPRPMGETSTSDHGKHTALSFPGYLISVWALAMGSELAFFLGSVIYATLHYLDTGCLWVQAVPLLRWPDFLVAGCPIGT